MQPRQTPRPRRGQAVTDRQDAIETDPEKLTPPDDVELAALTRLVETDEDNLLDEWIRQGPRHAQLTIAMARANARLMLLDLQLRQESARVYGEARIDLQARNAKFVRKEDQVRVTEELLKNVVVQHHKIKKLELERIAAKVALDICRGLVEASRDRKDTLKALQEAHRQRLEVDHARDEAKKGPRDWDE